MQLTTRAAGVSVLTLLLKAQKPDSTTPIAKHNWTVNRRPSCLMLTTLNLKP